MIVKALVALVAASTAGMARAQTPQVNGSIVEYQFSWHDNGNNDGILQPGEGAVMSLTIAFTPPSGSPITWNPVIGGSGSGEVRGLQAAFFDFVGSSNTAQGIWSDLLVDWFWEIGPFPQGMPALGGSRVNNIQAGQFPAQQSSVNTTNPIFDLWTGTWTPLSYTPRSESFSMQNASAAIAPFPSFVIVRDPALPNTVLVGTSAHSANSIVIPIVPAPASLAVLGAVALSLIRRGRAAGESRP